MRRFERQPPPPFWPEVVAQWVDAVLSADDAPPSAKEKLRGWQREGHKLSQWFHQTVRPEGEPRLCAYCDGLLLPQSGETIDHFIPEHVCRPLAMSWENLYPSCTACNTKFKGTRWSLRALRPDVDPVDEWLDLDPETGELRVAAEFERNAWVRRRVNKTIRLFNLNLPARMRGRLKVLEELKDARKAENSAYIEACRNEGPYRFVVERWLEATSGASEHDEAAANPRSA